VLWAVRPQLSSRGTEPDFRSAIAFYPDCRISSGLGWSTRVPTLLLHAGDFGLVREEQVDAYRLALGDLVEIVEVPGGHMVYWDAYEETADALERFLDAG